MKTTSTLARRTLSNRSGCARGSKLETLYLGKASTIGKHSIFQDIALGGGSAGARRQRRKGGAKVVNVSRGGKASTVLWYDPTTYNDRWQQVAMDERLIAVWFIGPNQPDGRVGSDPPINAQRSFKERLLSFVGGSRNLTKRNLANHHNEVAEFLHGTPGGMKLFSRQFGFGQPVLQLETIKPQYSLYPNPYARFSKFDALSEQLL